MTFTRITSGPIGTNCYVYQANNGEVYIIDAPPESYTPLRKYLKENNLNPTHLLLTHSHWDHIADAYPLKETFSDMLVGIHKNDVGNLQNPGSDGLPIHFKITPLDPDYYFSEGDQIGPFQVIETPGHTPGGVVFYDSAKGILFSGDTLFYRSMGSLSLPTARPELMWKSLKKLATLPEKVQVFPGHGGPTTIGEENWLASAEETFGN